MGAAAAMSMCSAGVARIKCMSSSHEVYVAAVALRGAKGPPQILLSAAYTLNFWNLQHFMVIIKPSNSSLLSHHNHNHNQVLVCDFQPKDPENVWVAAAALSGIQVSGVILVRKLGKVPSRKCWFVGYSNENAIEAANQFNQHWDTNLKIGSHDCRNYCQGLVEHLTGKKIVLEQLRKSKNTSSMLE